MNPNGGKRGNEPQTLEQRVALLERLLQQVPSRFSYPPSLMSSNAIMVNQEAHDFAIGEVVYQAWNDPDYTWTKAWGFIGLEHAGDGRAVTGAFGVVSRVVGANRFEVVSAGEVSNLLLVEGEAALDPQQDIGVDLYLTDNVDSPGRVSRYRTASSIRIATALPSATASRYVVRVSRESSASFAVATLNYASLGLSEAFIPVVVDDGTAPVALASYTDEPEPDDLRLAICKYDALRSVVLMHGKVWRSTLFAGISPAPRAGARFLGTGGNMVDGDGWLDPTPTLHNPMIRLGRYDGARGFEFDPRHETSLQHAWDLKAGEGTGLGAVLEDGDVPYWDEAEERFRTGKPYLPSEAEGPCVIGRIEPGEGAVIAFQATLALGGLFLGDDGNLIWKLVGPENMDPFPAYAVLANITDTEAPSEHLEAPDGTVLGRVGDVMGFGSDPELGTAAAGGGYLKVHFAAGKYVEIAASGAVTVYHSASLKFELTSAGVLRLTWGSGNTFTLDPSHVSGSGLDIRLRELDYCEGGVAQKRWVPCDAGH